ncbi:hypothetical protein H6G94_12075 [Nostoc punctiforme FACHB-252]|uniref:TPM domain-containing protein n=1 Tax=Nostoc punctiforme FACHB-252 TaxID=1357509 RepID=A0ABR8H9R7_NOSPU|nr:hypothetical protein [Nostoc punctiforme]MBD2612006.1 hypothetical protein [Nostoc punctiforme FACHB-252]
MQLYVQSRGINQEYDYRWLKIKQHNQVPEIPPILQTQISDNSGTAFRVADMIDSQVPSIILIRSNGELLLLVTALEAREERIDFMGRRVRNSVVWIYPENNEQALRSLTVRALRGELQQEVDRAITIGGEYGFTVLFEEITRLANPEAIDNYEADLKPKIGKNFLKLREELALELERHKLPQRNGLLILVTSIKTKPALIEANVWRGLSNRLVNDDWEIIPEKKSLTGIWILVLAVVIVLAIALLLIIIIPQKIQPKTNSSPPPQINKILQETNHSLVLFPKNLMSN